MTTTLDRDALDDRPLAPVAAALRAMCAAGDEVPAITPGLLVADPAGWRNGADLAGALLATLLDTTRREYGAQQHAAATLAWKEYTYWLALPAVLGWASARRVPLLRADDVLVHFADRRNLVTLGLRDGITVAVLPSDPLAFDRPGSDQPALGGPRVQVRVVA
ncbi:MAG TPA: hypothetical protein VFO77_08825, partial [Actinoplanes sp.]|nr:hypothetical protein [Actinoplanes sp.]